MSSSSNGGGDGSSASGAAPPASSTSTSSSLLFSSAPRLRASLLLSAVNEFRASQQQLFAAESLNFPSSASGMPLSGGGGSDGSADNYSRMWSSFQQRDDEAAGVVAQLQTVCQHLEHINKVAHSTNNSAGSAAAGSSQPTSQQAAAPQSQQTQQATSKRTAANRSTG